MSGRVVVSTSGFRDLEKALAELPKATARNVLKRTLVKAGEPIAEKARDLVPVDKGRLRDSIVVSARIKNKVGNAEFSAAMRAGLGALPGGGHVGTLLRRPPLHRPVGG